MQPSRSLPAITRSDPNENPSDGQETAEQSKPSKVMSMASTASSLHCFAAKVSQDSPIALRYRNLPCSLYST